MLAHRGRLRSRRLRGADRPARTRPRPVHCASDRRDRRSTARDQTQARWNHAAPPQRWARRTCPHRYYSHQFLSIVTDQYLPMQTGSRAGQFDNLNEGTLHGPVHCEYRRAVVHPETLTADHVEVGDNPRAAHTCTQSRLTFRRGE